MLLLDRRYYWPPPPSPPAIQIHRVDRVNYENSLEKISMVNYEFQTDRKLIVWQGGARPANSPRRTNELQQVKVSCVTRLTGDNNGAPIVSTGHSMNFPLLFTIPYRTHLIRKPSKYWHRFHNPRRFPTYHAKSVDHIRR